MPDRINVPDQPGWDQVFAMRNSPVGRDLSNRATRVQLAAKAQAGVRTGALKRDITKNWVGRGLTIRVGSSRPYALMHHEGTRPHIIRPRRAKALRWVNARGEVVFAQVVRHPGTHPNRNLEDNLPLAVQ
jgi:hypothetical protein